MAAATPSREALEPLLGATIGALGSFACHEAAYSALGISETSLLVKQLFPQHATFCLSDKTAASTCILAEGVQQADERAAKKAR
jgi:hypothetical protein